MADFTEITRLEWDASQAFETSKLLLENLDSLGAGFSHLSEAAGNFSVAVSSHISRVRDEFQLLTRDILAAQTAMDRIPGGASLPPVLQNPAVQGAGYVSSYSRMGGFSVAPAYGQFPESGPLLPGQPGPVWASVLAGTTPPPPPPASAPSWQDELQRRIQASAFQQRSTDPFAGDPFANNVGGQFGFPQVNPQFSMSMLAQQEQLSWLRAQADARDQLGNSTPYSPGISSFDALRAEARRMTDQAQLEALDPFKKLRDQSNPEDAFRDLRSTAQAEQEKYWRTIGDGADDAGKKVSDFQMRFERHLQRIIEGVAIYFVLREMAAIVKGLADEWLNLENVSARVSAVSGQSIGAATGQVQSGFAQAAQYGISPIQAGAGVLAGQQLGSSQLQQQQAGQLALVFGAQTYASSLESLTRIQLQSNSVGLAHVNVMGVISSLYKSTPDSIDNYLRAIQAGVTVYKDFGTTAEQASYAIERIAFITRTSPDTAANMISRITATATQAGQAGNLTQFGITATEIPQVLQQAAAAMNNLLSTGQDARAQQLADLLGAGGFGSQRIRELPLIFQELSKSMTVVVDSGSKMNEIVQKIASTPTAEWDRLNASIKSTFASFADTGPMQAFNTALVVALDTATKLVEAVQKLPNTSFGRGMGLTSSGVGAAAGAAGRGALSDWLFNMLGLGVGVGPNPTIAPGTFGEESTVPTRYIPTPPPFGGFGQLPQGTTFDVFQQAVAKYEKIVEAQAPALGYKVDPKTFAYYDETTKSFQTLVADSEAIALATKATADNTAKITGVFNAPAGANIMLSLAAAQAGIVQSGTPGAETAYTGSRGGESIAHSHRSGTPGAETAYEYFRTPQTSNYTGSRGGESIAHSHRSGTPGAETAYEYFRTPQTSNYTGSRGGESITHGHQMPLSMYNAHGYNMNESPSSTRKGGPTNTNAPAGQSPIGLTNIINVMVDGAVLAKHMDRKLYDLSYAAMNGVGGQLHGAALMI